MAGNVLGRTLKSLHSLLFCWEHNASHPKPLFRQLPVETCGIEWLACSFPSCGPSLNRVRATLTHFEARKKQGNDVHSHTARPAHLQRDSDQHQANGKKNAQSSGLVSDKYSAQAWRRRLKQTTSNQQKLDCKLGSGMLRCFSCQPSQGIPPRRHEES